MRISRSKKIAKKLMIFALSITLIFSISAPVFGEEMSDEVESDVTLEESQDQVVSDTSEEVSDEELKNEVVSADGQEQTEEYSEEAQETQIAYVNPYYSDIVDKDDLVQPEDVEESTNSSDEISLMTDGDINYYKSTSTAGAKVRSSLVNREASIVVGMEYSSSSERSNNYMSDYKAIINDAMKHTGNPQEGDYLKWQYKGCVVKILTVTAGNKYYATYSFTMSYFTTAAQEQAVTTKVDSILRDLNLSGKSDYEKVSAIYKYICKTVKYDNAGAASDTDYNCHSAYAAIIDQEAVCQGYSLMFYRLALESGVDNRLVVGKTSGGKSHAWNRVKVDGKYYYVDATWDTGKTTFKYFLRGRGKSGFTGHGSYTLTFPDNGSIVSVADHSFAPSATKFSSLKASKKAFTAKWSKVSNAAGYQIRYSKYSSMKKATTKTIKSGNTTSLKVSKLSKKKKYYVQIRAYRTVSGKTYYSSWSSKKTVKTK